MKRNSITILLTLAALIVPQQSVTASQAKAGAKCAKVNSIQTVGGKKFTCIKSGSKFIWNKGVTLPKPAAPTATLPTTEPAPTDFQMPAPMILQVWAQTRSEPAVYLNDVPKARQLIRWPKQDSSWGPAKLVIVYENLSTKAVPCDLSKALCLPNARVDTTVYMKIIEDKIGKSNKFILDKAYKIVSVAPSVFFSKHINLKSLLGYFFLIFIK